MTDPLLINGTEAAAIASTILGRHVSYRWVETHLRNLRVSLGPNTLRYRREKVEARARELRDVLKTVDAARYLGVARHILDRRFKHYRIKINNRDVGFRKDDLDTILDELENPTEQRSA